jgi:hypothetical protein
MSNWFWRRDLIIVICGGLCFAFSALASAPQEASKKKLILKHDPTRPAVTEVAVETDKKELKEEAYVLSSIIVSPTRRIALINAKFVKVGDTIGEASVL